MFAVKGWNVDAGLLKPQTELFANAQATEGKHSRKRKRDRGEHPVHEADVQKQRQQQQPTQEKQSKKQKKQKAKSDEHQSVLPATDTSVARISKANEIEADRSQNAEEKKSSRKHKQVDKTAAKAGQAATGSAIVKSSRSAAGTPTLTPMQSAMRQKLVSARFRHLNETLYTAPSQQAQELFNANPDMFEDYHAGFRRQVSVWPENPVDKLIEKVRQRGIVRLPSQKRAFKTELGRPGAEYVGQLSTPPLPRTQGTCFIADCGCGDARLAQTLKTANDVQKLQVKVLSYDLHSPSSLVTKADISALPLADGSVDVAIFCLALMGTNWISFIEEAYRVLHWKGELWIAEIKSRFARIGKRGKVVEHSVGNRRNRAVLQKEHEAKRMEQEEALHDEVLQTEVDGVEKAMQETDVQAFVEVLKRRGFLLKDEQASIDLSNKMFVSMEFIKAATPTKGKGFVEPATTGKKFIKRAPVEQEVLTEDERKTLKPCLYKIR